MNFTDLADDPEDDQHSPAERAAAASRSTWVSVAVNVVLTATQIAVGVLAKSQGLVADGIHSLSDLVADFVVLFASHHSKKDADEDHPYGHQRFETAASLVLGVLLLAVGVGMLWSAFRKLEAPETRADGARRRALGGRRRAGREGTAVPLHAVGGQARQVEHAGGQRLACTLRRGVVAGGGHRHRRQPGRLPDPGPDRRADRRLHGRAGWAGGSAGTRCTT